LGTLAIRYYWASPVLLFNYLPHQVPTPPMPSFKFALWSFLASTLAVCAFKNITVDDFDPRIVYTPSSTWIHENSGATLDRLNLTTSYTGDLALASIKFNGTAVYLISYGLPSPLPDKYQVTVDGQTETRSLRVSSDSERAQFMAYSRTGLDASTEHQITISNPNRVSLNIDAFIITVPDNSTMRDGFGNASDQSQEQTQSQSNGGSGLTAATKAGIAIAVIGGILLGLLLAIGISYWKRKRQSKSRGDTSERMEGGDSAVQVLETRQSGVVVPFVGTASGLPSQPREFRKERRPNGETYRVPETPGEIDERATTTSGVTSPHPAPSTPSVISAYPPPYVG